MCPNFDLCPYSSCIYVDHQEDDLSVSNNLDDKAHIACIMAPVKNFSSFGTFTTGSTNEEYPFIMLDFTPSFIIIKNQEKDEKWFVVDNSRPGYNEESNVLSLNVPAPVDDDEVPLIHFLSNGFRLTGKHNEPPRIEDDVYFYMAFAANPFFSNGGISR